MNCTIFEYSGCSDCMQIRLELYQKGIAQLDYDSFAQNDTQLVNEMVQTKLDEITFDWKDGNVQNNNNNSSIRRLFVTNSLDDLPENIRKKMDPEYNRDTSDLSHLQPDKEFVKNDFVKYSKMRNQVDMECIKREKRTKRMFILTNIGTLNENELVAMITDKNECRLIIEPSMNHDGEIKLKTNKADDYYLKITIDHLNTNDKNSEEDDVEHGRRSNRPSITSIPEASQFALPRDGVIEAIICVTLENAQNLIYRDGIVIDYSLVIKNDAIRLLEDYKKSGVTQQFGGSQEPINMSQTIEFGFEIDTHALAEDQIDVMLLLRLISNDYWGRQYVAGYGSMYLELQPGRHDTAVSLWRPATPFSLYETFMGQSIDIDYWKLMEKSPLNVSNIHGESCGSLNVSYSCIMQSRLFMSHDILYRMNFGTKMAEMGLKSDFYQRILKVLMEFEEARSRLLLARSTLARKSRKIEDSQNA